MLRGLAVGAASGALTLLGARGASAGLTCRGAGRLCDLGANNCCAPATCQRDARGYPLCTCPSAQVACRGACVDPASYQTDPNSCGRCGNRCPLVGNGTPTCTAGVCGAACNPGYIPCGGVCIPACPAPDQCHEPGGCDPATRTCTNPAKPDGAACDDSNGQPGVCQGGACVACLALGEPCAVPAQCCQDAPTTCGPVSNFFVDECCRPLGAPCGTLGAFGECCAVLFTPTSGTSVSCSPGGVCGGPGAACTSDEACASGVCCGFLIEETCCAAGQRCEGNECVGP